MTPIRESTALGAGLSASTRWCWLTDGFFTWLGALALIALTVGISAYPVVRRLTRGLERLNRSVEALGAGNLSARVPVQGPEEVARLAATFNRAAERIETLVRANKTLLANASHELRSPLARLRMGVEVLSGSAPAEVRDEVNRNVRELDQLIDEILLASRLDGQAVDHAEFEFVDLAGLAAEECAREGADLTVPETGAAGVMGDPRLLRRLLRNLLENGRRHGDGTPVEVVLKAREDRHIEIDVLDRGPGVAAAERERIFEPFYRLPGIRERDGGAGLGLALVRQIAGRHGGTAACLARDGGGSCFRVTLPAAPSAAGM
jgi:signal transduction histidine kinase